MKQANGCGIQSLVVRFNNYVFYRPGSESGKHWPPSEASGILGATNIVALEPAVFSWIYLLAFLLDCAGQLRRILGGLDSSDSLVCSCREAPGQVCGGRLRWDSEEE